MGQLRARTHTCYALLGTRRSAGGGGSDMGNRGGWVGELRPRRRRHLMRLKLSVSRKRDIGGKFPLLGNSAKLGALRSPCLEPATEQPTAHHDTRHALHSHRTQTVDSKTHRLPAPVQASKQRHQLSDSSDSSDISDPCFPHARTHYFHTSRRRRRIDWRLPA